MQSGQQMLNWIDALVGTVAVLTRLPASQTDWPGRDLVLPRRVPSWGLCRHTSEETWHRGRSLPRRGTRHHLEGSRSAPVCQPSGDPAMAAQRTALVHLLVR